VLHIGDAGMVGRGGESFVEDTALSKRAGCEPLLGEAGVDRASRGIDAGLKGLGWLTFTRSVNREGGAVVGTEKQGGGGRTSMVRWQKIAASWS
jgi:hypothetical protein